MIRKSILVVDDEEMLVELSKKILEKQGHEVTMFTYSIDALIDKPYHLEEIIDLVQHLLTPNNTKVL